jgi:hypothetical protein
MCIRQRELVRIARRHRRIGDQRTAGAVVLDVEIARRVLAQQRDLCGVRPVRHDERAARGGPLVSCIQLAEVLEMKWMSARSMKSGTPKPATSPPKCIESSSRSIPPPEKVRTPVPVLPPLAMSNVPALITVALANPPEATYS